MLPEADAFEVHLHGLQRKLMTEMAGRVVRCCVKLLQEGRVLAQREKQSEELLMAGKAMAPGRKLSGWLLTVGEEEAWAACQGK